jgi:hypothetical protein
VAALGSSSSGTAPRVAQPRPVPSPRVAAASKAVGATYRPPGVEKGVTGKEKQFQQSRQFGPGPIKPYPGAKGPPPSQSFPKPAGRSGGTAAGELSRKGLVPSHARSNNAIGTGERVRVGDGVYRGSGSSGTKNTPSYKRGENAA